MKYLLIRRCSLSARNPHLENYSKNYAVAVYSVNVNDGYPVSGTISIMLSNIFRIKMESDLVSLLKPKFYKLYVDDISRKRAKSQTDEPFTRLINQHSNIKFSVEVY